MRCSIFQLVSPWRTKQIRVACIIGASVNDTPDTWSILNNPFHTANSGNDFVLCIPLRGLFAHRQPRR